MSPLPLGAAGSQSILFFGLLVFGGVALLAIFAAIRRSRAATLSEIDSDLAVARPRRFRVAEPLPYPVNVKLGYDGFWLESATLPAGTLIYYECTFERKVRPGRVRYTPHAKGQFVFTGEKPLAVLVLRMVLPGADDDGPDGEFGPGNSPDIGESSAAAAAWHLTHDHHRPDNSPGPGARADPPAY